MMVTASAARRARYCITVMSPILASAGRKVLIVTGVAILPMRIMSPLIAMTIGGWCLGNAWSAWIGLRRPMPAAFCPALYIALFGMLQVAVVVTFRAALLTAELLTWLYLTALAVNFVFALSFLFYRAAQASAREEEAERARVGAPLTG